MAKAVIILVLLLTLVSGCAGMSNTEQRILSGGAIGAAGGAVVGAVAGAPALGAGVGAGLGLAGGVLYDQYQKTRGAQ
jgi:osmotically inducible lipoprotein OsmB